MSEQLVIILLIATTLTIVLIALAIPDEPTPTADVNETGAPDIDYTMRRANGSAINDDLDSEIENFTGVPGDDSDDARRATGIPEKARR